MKTGTLLYHVTKTPYADRVVFNPKVPEYPVAGEDAVIPRVCFCPTVEGALAATGYAGEVYVYQAQNYTGRLERDVRDKVPDAVFTGEVWALDPVELVYVGTLQVQKEYLRIGSTSFPVCRYEVIENVGIPEDRFSLNLSLQRLYDTMQRFSKRWDG